MNPRLATIPILTLIAGISPPAMADIFISEVVDGTLPNGQPKWVELTNSGSSTVILAGFSLGVMNNGANTMSSPAHVLTGSLPSGASHVIALEPDNGPGTSQFFAVYGQDPDEHSGDQINGDDTVLLYQGAASGDGSNGTLVDAYGVIGVSGTGTSWDYLDSYAARCGSAANAGVFDAADWDIPGAGALLAGCAGDDTCEAANLVAMTSPWSHPGCIPAQVGTPYCTGDQGTCPCANDNDGSSGSAGCANSASNGGASLTATGSSSLSAADLNFHCTSGASLQAGIFFQGNNTIQGGAGAPFGAGLRCAGGAAVRLEVVSSGTFGSSSTQVDVGLMGGASAGDTKRYQLWYADTGPTAPCGGGFNFTNGLEITWGA